MKSQIVLLSILLLPGCATSIDKLQKQQENQIAALCDADHSYVQGVSDGRAGKTADTWFVTQCPQEQRKNVGESYLRGYEEGAEVFRQINPAHQLIVRR